MQLQRALRLHSDFGTERKDAVAFVGAGGKTTAMFRLARELAAPSVIVAATTHLGAWQIPLADRHVIAESAGEIREIPAGVTLVTGRVEGDRTQSVSASALFWLREEAQSRGIPLLIEADGARQKPLKAPAAHEPPIPDFAETVVLVAGLSGLGKPITEESVFRAEKFRELSGAAEGESVTPEILRRVLAHPEGGLKNIPTRARKIALLNQADTPEFQSIGGKLARELLASFDAAIVGSAQRGDFHAFERMAGIVLAAGESTRFGQPKQLLDWKGEPFVRRIAETALGAGLAPVVVVTGANAEAVEGAVRDLDMKIVRNAAWQSGQASSIVAGVAALPENIGGCLFLLADQPQVGAEIIHALTESHARNLSPVIAPLVMEERRANPVLFDRVTFADLLQLKGDVGGRAIFHKYKVDYLPWHDETLLLDVDTPEDYERLRRL